MNFSTVCAPSTPPLNSAIAVIRITGPKAFDSLRLIRPARPAEHGRARFGSVFFNERHIDDIVCLTYKAPGSYTGEDTVELFCHGNPIIVRDLLSALNSIGIEAAGPGEFTRRAFLNGKLDLTAAEAVNHIITARSSWEIETSLKQMHGSIRRLIDEIRAEIIELKADIEAVIDFPEEDIPFIENSEALFKTGAVSRKIQEFYERCRAGERAAGGVNIIITGKPNVGKSSLLNILLNRERAIVSEIPGTTRDMIRETIEINGLPVNLIDTAGINDTDDKIEKIGVEISRKNIETAAVVIALFDPVQGFGGADIEILEKIRGRPAIRALNKVDIASREDMEKLEAAIGRENEIYRISAKDGSGLQSLRDALSAALRDEFSGLDNSFLADERVIGILKKGADQVLEIEELLQKEAGPEIVAFELQALIDLLGEITGDISPDDVLESVFSRFCIGK